MAERSMIDQLNDAVAALAEERQVDLTSLTPELSGLVEVAQGLIGLPSETFKAELQQQLIRRDVMSSPATQPEPELTPVRSLSLYLCIAGASEAIDFYREAFGATELSRLAEPDGRIGHAEIQIGNTVIMLSDEYPDYGVLSPPTIGGSPMRIHLEVSDVDAFAARAIKAGATLTRPIEDQFYGDRSGQIADPFGYTWMISTHVKDVPTEDIQKEFDKFTAERSAKNSYEGSVREDKMRRENRRAVTPYLTVHKPGELIDFVTAAFGGIEHFRATGSAGGMHAEVSIGDSVVMIGGAEHIAPMPTAMRLYVPDVDETYERALRAGAKSLMPVADQPYGERSGGVEDVHGNRWYIARPFVPLQTIAKDLHTVTVYFHPIGAQRFVDFVTQAFNGKELMRHAEGDMILHAKVQIGNSVIELGEARYPTQPLPTAIYLYVDDVDATYEQALNAGGVSMLAPVDQPFGDRNAWVKDPFANVWYIAAPIKT
jgi:PhnB protein